MFDPADPMAEAIAGMVFGFMWSLACGTKVGRIGIVALIVVFLSLRISGLGPIEVGLIFSSLVNDVRSAFVWLGDHQLFGIGVPLGASLYQFVKWIGKHWPKPPSPPLKTPA